MGPYCAYCMSRCFVHVPAGLPAWMYATARGRADIVATCRGGKAADRRALGWSIDDAREALAEARPPDRPSDGPGGP